jgi:hypothetical protein
VSVEIGSYLRQAREALGMTLDQVQEKTKIQKSFLIAIENGEFHKLPSPFYVRTYLRSYANCVKVEPHHILRQYRKMEQAERLTGVHKAVSESDLSQTMRFSTQGTGKMPVFTPGTGPQRAVSQETMAGRQPVSEKTLSRISINTALTAAKSETSKLRDRTLREREIARRDLGYQRTSGMMRNVPPRQNESELPTVAAAMSKGSPAEPAQKQVPPFPGDGTAATIPPRRTREVAKQNSQSLPVSGPVGSIGKQNPKASAPTGGMDPVSSTGPHQQPLSFGSRPADSRETAGGFPSRNAAAKGMTGSMGTVGSLSRSSRSRRDTIPPSAEPVVPASAEVAAGESKPLSQGSSRMTTLSRSAVKNRKPSKSGTKMPLKRAVVAAVAGLVLCGSLAWGVTTMLADEGSKKASEPKQPKVASDNTGKTSQQVQPASKGELVAAGSGQNTNHYQLKGTDQILVEFQATGGKCWIQIRNTPAVGENYLEDRTLTKKGDGFKFPYTFGDQNELWITLGEPANVVVKVNGDLINPAKNVHIKKVD